MTEITSHDVVDLLSRLAEIAGALESIASSLETIAKVVDEPDDEHKERIADSLDKIYDLVLATTDEKGVLVVRGIEPA